MWRSLKVFALITVMLAAQYGQVWNVEAAGKVTVYVLDSITYYEDEMNDLKTKITYTKAGMVKSVSTNGMYGGGAWFREEDYTYDNKQRIKKKEESGRYAGEKTSRYYYKGNRLVKKKSSGMNAAGEEKEIHAFFYDKKNRVKQIKITGDSVRVQSYQYDQKNRVKLISYKYTDSDSKDKITYDSKGYIKSMGQTRYKNAYKGSRLVKRWEDRDKTPNKYNYKKIKVSKKYLSRIKKQQWSLLNSDLNFALY